MAAQDITAIAQTELTVAYALGFGLSLLLVQLMDVYLFVGVPVPPTEYVIEESQQVLY